LRYELLLLREEYLQAMRVFEAAVSEPAERGETYVEHARRSGLWLGRAVALANARPAPGTERRRRVVVEDALRCWRMDLAILLSLGMVTKARADTLRSVMHSMERRLDAMARTQHGGLIPLADADEPGASEGRTPSETAHIPVEEGEF
jgi:hypothetical protein